MALLALGGASLASAQDPRACRIDASAAPPPPEFSHMGMLAHTGPAADAKRMLGPQFAGFWLQRRDLGWYVGVAPGPIDLEAARAQILERVDAHYSGADATLLRDRLHVVAQPYGDAELDSIHSQLVPELKAAGWGVGWMLGISCRHSDARRLELTLFNDSSDAILAAARRLAARWGDRVLVARLDVGPPSPDGATHPVGVEDLLALPRCARRSKATMRVRASARASIQRVIVAVRRERSVLRRSRLASPLKVPVKPRRTTRMRIAVRLRDGGKLTATRRLQPCRRHAPP